MKKILLLSTVIILSNLSCSVYETFVNIARLKFKLGQVNNFTLNGVSLSNKTKMSDFSPVELLKISSTFAQGDLPVSFILNVEAKNPNDGTGGYPRSSATIKSFPWRLLIDNKETVSGNINSPVIVPGTGETTFLPIQINLDLLSFFKDKGYESILNLALNLGGYGGSSSKLTLYANPVVSTSFGNLSYPGELKIVNVEFTNSSSENFNSK